MKNTIHLFTLLLCLFFVGGLTGCGTQNQPGGHADYSYTPPQQLISDILRELNGVRTNPQSYAKTYIQPRLKHFDGTIYTGGGIRLRTNEGAAAVQDCINVLNSTNPVDKLRLEKGLNQSAQWLANDQAAHNLIGHTGSDGSDMITRMNRYGKWNIRCGENCSYGSRSAREIVIQLLVDNGVPDRGHRKNILDPRFKKVGIGFSDKDNAPYGAVCVMDFAGNYTSK